MKTEIDKKSGFCFGVVYAIQKAEQILKTGEKLYCLGDIVHNNVEVRRLEDMGLVTINHEQLKELKNCKILIRAHGEPAETYRIIFENILELIDASCPVVLKLQNKIKDGYEDIKDKGQVVIYGKKGHAEVNGLVSQTQNKAIVIENEKDIEKIDFSKSINLFSQTTKSLSGYKKIKQLIEKKKNPETDFINNKTVCGQVAFRGEELPDFAKKHDVVIFVSGKKSSNGKMLYEICKKENKNSYFISDTDEIQENWFKNNMNIGICGATSTPMWLMEKIEKHIQKIKKI